MFKKIREISLYKSLKISIKYFGIKGFYLPILVSKNTIIQSMKGSITIDEIKPLSIKIGFTNISIFNGKSTKTIVNLQKNSSINFKGKSFFGIGSVIDNDGELWFGKNFVITAKSTIICKKSMHFGDDVIISWENLLMDTDFHKIYINDKRINKNSDIMIGNKVWITTGNTFLKGTEISDGCVVASNSLLNKKYQLENSLIAGSPAKIIKKDIKWEL
ncbi:MAG: acyltransferase [Culicoidibacterales bacterium]